MVLFISLYVKTIHVVFQIVGLTLELGKTKEELKQDSLNEEVKCN